MDKWKPVLAEMHAAVAGLVNNTRIDDINSVSLKVPMSKPERG